MTLLERLRKQLAEKRSQIDNIGQASERENRDLTPDEQEQMDGLLDEVEQLKARVDSLEAVQADADSEANANRGRGRRSTPIGTGGGPAIHSSDDRQPYSFIRAIRSASEGRLDGLEAEVSQEIIRRSERRPRTNGFMMPLGSDPVIRALMNRGLEKRDLTTTTGAGTVFNEMGGPLIELLRPKLVLRDLGCTVLSDVNGVFSLPAQTGASQFYWIGEGVPASLSNQTFAQIPFTPKIGMAATNFTSELLAQSSLDIEAEVKNDLAAVVARASDYAGINGPGGASPLGILQRSGITVVPLGTNGGPMTYQNAVSLESAVAVQNADQGKLGYLTNPQVRGDLKVTPMIAPASGQAGYPIFVYQKGSEPGVGEMNGYPVRVTTQVPSNLTKGSSSGVCSAVIYGNWADAVLAYWEGVDTVVNPYTNQLSGGVVVSMKLAMDFEIKHLQSFAITNDVVTS